ncbi:glycosyltransferase [Caldanaerobacter subterraneus]|uniref:glycosyltransferase n=1 Tax=Caldanaerobacter subterraneus TaxID=911092 RepID=UPI002441B929|nr:glycosyltransferase [Caldanaerobacter subterraneus]
MPDIDSTLFAKPEVEPVHLIMVARFEEQKDHILLLETLEELKDLSWTFELVGDGPLIGIVRERAEKLGISDKVQFSGACDDVPFRLAKAQIFILTSKWEGFPRSILEAMRAGLPVIASDVGGVKEAVIDGLTGYIIPRGDKEELKKRLKELILDSHKRIRFGLAGRKRYEEFFTFERMAKQTMEVYQEVIRQKSSKML